MSDDKDAVIKEGERLLDDYFITCSQCLGSGFSADLYEYCTACRGTGRSDAGMDERMYALFQKALFSP